MKSIGITLLFMSFLIHKVSAFCIMNDSNPKQTINYKIVWDKSTCSFEKTKTLVTEGEIAPDSQFQVVLPPVSPNTGSSCSGTLTVWGASTLYDCDFAPSPYDIINEGTFQVFGDGCQLNPTNGCIRKK